MSGDLPRTAKVATVWLLLGLVLFVAVLWWQRSDRQMRFTAQGEIIEIRRSIDGHYHWPGRINGREVDFLIDTGATTTAISVALAHELRLQPIGTTQSSTAGGMVTGQLVLADVVLQGGVSARGLRVTALPELRDHPLLGMDVLARLRWGQGDGRLRIDLRSTP